jgi:hypothetical protein
MRSVFRSCQSMSTPNERTSSTSVSMSRMRGTLVSVTGWSVMSAAATMGSAAFLLPEGVMEPWRGRPPSTRNCTELMLLSGGKKCVG